MQKGFTFDLNRCTGCGACMVGCTIQNQERQTKNWRQVYTFNDSHVPAIPVFKLSLACNHCGSPACLENCPALAISKDEETGAVVVDQDLCMGCKYCTWACPYDVPQYNETTGTVEKCDFCIERLKDGETTACVKACPTDALGIADLEPEEESKKEPVPGFTEAGLKPSISFTRLRRVAESSLDADENVIRELFESSQKIPATKISLKVEWALLVFTSIAYILVAYFTASLSTDLPVNPFLFLGAGVVAMGLSTIHLGHKERAYRAVFNITSSWLSREIFLFSYFLGLSGLYLLFMPNQQMLGWVAAFTGFVALFAVDRIYQMALQVGPYNFHSAQTLFNGLFLAGILMGNAVVYGGAALVKIVLYIYRKMMFKRLKRPVHLLVSAARLVFGFLVPIGLSLGQPGIMENITPLVAGSVILGELIDRTEFYDELDIITPPKQILTDLTKAVSKKYN